ncbi:3-oxoadipate enol-lactonase/4-carboxymuconolactone decarboxylase [Oceanisphaera litoralis]|uniref:bifunctional 3-oxoadipate enol-lactonase/4-carboxymuconolactone decarboxylase PcaDC n=1 Tax=Oceanisphaera litoralis TaxID=225144 RepID=UPI001EF9291B|nr:3-oxoadipate enol-lactonase [Oceanisphaera litoralis]MBM7456631.1 3-oxoadipate enol-lactonase/4-carboxymuconolactone decarboxylase [Oceanisphaera litoralis]
MTQTLAINGVMLHYRLEGPSHLPLLVFSNSLGTDLRVWEPLLPLLANHFRFLRYDKRGHGLSACPPAPYHIDDHINDLIGLLDALQLDQVALCGLSVGGIIAQGVASRRPELVKQLILCDTAHKIGPAQGWDDRINSIRGQGIEVIADAVMERWFAAEFRRQQPVELALWRNMLVRTPMEGYIGTCAAIRDADLTDSSARLTQPTLCLVGDQDGATPPELVRSTAELIPNSRFAIIDNAGHLPCVEQPAALAALITDFIGQRTAPPNRFDLGMAVRRSVLGHAHVDRANANKSVFDEPFQTFITEGAWGSVWSRPGLSKRDRSLLTIALMASLGHEEELAMHIRATRNTGASKAEVQETLLHLAVYAGVPASNTAFRIAKEVYNELENQEEQ